MDTKQKKEYLDTFPMQRLLGIGAPEITFYNTTTGYQALCPFHGDKHLGSFIVNPATGIWKCFACGEGGRGIYKFLMRLNDWSFTEAVQYLYDHKDDPVSPMSSTIPTALLGKSKPAVIVPASSQKTNSYARSSQKEPIMRAFPSSYIDILQKEDFLKHDPVTPQDMDQIYSAFAAASPLSESEISNLRAKRGLSYTSTKDFFRFPSNLDISFWDRFRKLLRKYDEADEEERLYHSLLGVPGFFWDAKENRPSFVWLRGSLGILSHNTEGLINGIELRTRAQSGKPNRYIAFSSHSVCLRNPDRYSMGTKLESVVDVVPMAYIKERKGIAITEGKFKAIHLSYHGYTALNVRGIINWRQVLPVLKVLGEDTVTIAFDADMKVNPAVAKAAGDLARALMDAGYKTQFLSWPIRHGKGFDDLCNAGMYSSAITVPAARYLETTIDPFLEREKIRKRQQKQALA